MMMIEPSFFFFFGLFICLLLGLGGWGAETTGCEEIEVGERRVVVRVEICIYVQIKKRLLVFFISNMYGYPISITYNNSANFSPTFQEANKSCCRNPPKIKKLLYILDTIPFFFFPSIFSFHTHEAGGALGIHFSIYKISMLFIMPM